MDRLLDAVPEHRFRFPSELVMNLRRVDRIATVVPLAIGNVRDQTFRLAELFADDLDDVDVSHFVMTADVVHLSDASFVNDQIDRATVIFNIKPVANVESFAINRKRLVVQGVDDHQRNQFFRKMIRAVVV